MTRISQPRRGNAAMPRSQEVVAAGVCARGAAVWTSSSNLETFGLDHGALLIFDRRQAAAPLAERGELREQSHQGRRIQIMRL